MTDISLGSGGTPPVDTIRSGYMRLLWQRRIYSALGLAVLIFAMVWGYIFVNGRSGGGFFENVGSAFEVLGSLWSRAAEDWPTTFSYLGDYLPALLETVNIAAVATIIGGIMGAVLSLLTTRGMARWPRLVGLFRRVMDTMRAIPELVIALILIFILGAGPVAAVVAIAFHTGGALGKLFSEVNENASLKPVEGLQSVGASWGQRMLLGVVPQVAPNWLSYLLLRFEINIRASAILGYVGSGGLGTELRVEFSFGSAHYPQTVAILMLLLATIFLVDQSSSFLRHRLIHGSTTR